MIENILPRLEKVKRTGQNKWQACCPAHADKSPSLSFKQVEDGRILLHCFGGCSTHEVVSAIGLEMSDLFPPRESNYKPLSRPAFNALDALNALLYEIAFVLIVAKQLAGGTPLSEADLERVFLSYERFQTALQTVRAL
jgi:hypothetical protein